MADNSQITVSGNTDVREGDYLRVNSGKWWKTRMLVTRVGVTTINVRWHYFYEPWFQINTIWILFWANFLVWSVWNAST